jgi:membrane fusion protein (multidrug efflux system)
VWVDANFKEAQLKSMRAGQAVTLAADLYGGKLEYHGKVAGFGAGTGGAFALLPAQNASGNWVKVVQRIPLQVRVENKPGEPELRAGMSAEIEVDTGHKRQLRELLGGWLG